MTINKYFIYLFFTIVSTSLFAQNNVLKVGLGGVRHFNNKASGYTTSVEYQRDIHPKHAWGVEISYAFADSRGILPDNIKASNIILRDYTHIPELPNLGWNRNSFPAMSLKSKPDRYFNANLAVKYLNTVAISPKKALKLAIGTVLTFNDEMVIAELVEGAKFESPFSFDLINPLIPIFRYDTYIDLGVLPQIGYSYQFKEKIGIVFTHKYYIFTKSKKYFTTLEAAINIRF